MFRDAKQHYESQYRCDIPGGQTPQEVVGGLFDAVMRNDKEALGQVIRILMSNTFYLVCSRLDAMGCGTQENVDDVMQNICLEITKKSFRGFPEQVTEKTFYPVLLGMVEKCTKNFGKKVACHISREEYATEEYSSLDMIEVTEKDGSTATPQHKLLAQERSEQINVVLQKFVNVLSDSSKPPYQLLTYCYATLLPQIFRKTDNKKLLRQVDELSSRKRLPPNSHYNEEEKRLEGELARDSVVLMKWAVEAMYKRNVFQLDQEFVALYHMEKIAGQEFRWGEHYRNNLKKNYKDIPMKELIITDQFDIHTMDNWPRRVAASLLERVERELFSDREFCGRSRHMVENLLWELE